MSRAGRPKDAKSREYATGEVVLSRCPTCNSTDRSKYEKATEHEIVGEEDGKPYNFVIWRGCQCLNCGQWRRDRTVELRTTGEAIQQ